MPRFTKANLVFFFQCAAFGLLIALLLHYFLLQPGQRGGRKVTLTEANVAAEGSNRQQPFSYRDAVMRGSPSGGEHLHRDPLPAKRSATHPAI